MLSITGKINCFGLNTFNVVFNFHVDRAAIVARQAIQGIVNIFILVKSAGRMPFYHFIQTIQNFPAILVPLGDVRPHKIVIGDNRFDAVKKY